jgi:excisionase family DNA binding protein
MSDLAAALLADIGDELAEKLADAIARRIPASHPEAASPWLDAAEAAAHLRIGKSSLYRLQRQGVVPAYQDGAGARLFFHREELDSYRRSHPA